MTVLRARPIFSSSTLARLNFGEPVTAHDPDTGIDLSYGFEDVFEGRLRLKAGLLRDQALCVGCDPDDINLSATLLLDGIKAQLR